MAEMKISYLLRCQEDPILKQTPDPAEHFHAGVVSLNALIMASRTIGYSISLAIPS